MSEPSDLLLTELRKAIRVEPGDYIVLVDITQINPLLRDRLFDVGEALWKHSIRLYFVELTDLDAVRFVRVESPATIQVEEKA